MFLKLLYGFCTLYIQSVKSFTKIDNALYQELTLDRLRLIVSLYTLCNREYSSHNSNLCQYNKRLWINKKYKEYRPNSEIIAIFVIFSQLLIYIYKIWQFFNFPSFIGIWMFVFFLYVRGVNVPQIPQPCNANAYELYIVVSKKYASIPVKCINYSGQ